ncbi:hypothetical protein BB561_005381 [Smittium simulii]|uniref:YbaK/aminoacyl-tRNA synthetase-associated domain-containing protein n=1 Tax=Smittium simulii TaxID=133385 RepID=A0A2T9YAK6_9FUNG|nr:hypothetical protein BB561_005381 [Smittium simulii]
MTSSLLPHTNTALTTTHTLESLASSLSTIFTHPLLQQPYLEQFLRSAAEQHSLPCSSWPQRVLDVREAVQTLHILLHVRFYKVGPSYYEWSLQTRALRLCAPSTNHLCKCVIMQNKKWTPALAERLPFPKTICIIVQYSHSINTSKLADHFRLSISPPPPKSYFNFRLLHSSDAALVSGFEHNAVSCFAFKNNIPLLLSQNILSLSPPILFLGAGHPDWKIALPINSLLSSLPVSVADISTLNSLQN